MQPNIEIYTWQSCPFCIRAKALLKSKGVEYIWTWTSEYEGKDFYKKMGYEGFTEFKSFYPSGHSRIGYIKKL